MRCEPGRRWSPRGRPPPRPGACPLRDRARPARTLPRGRPSRTPGFPVAARISDASVKQALAASNRPAAASASMLWMTSAAGSVVSAPWSRASCTQRMASACWAWSSNSSAADAQPSASRRRPSCVPRSSAPSMAMARRSSGTARRVTGGRPGGEAVQQQVGRRCRRPASARHRMRRVGDLRPDRPACRPADVQRCSDRLEQRLAGTAHVGWRERPRRLQQDRCASPARPRANRIVPCSRLACARASGSPSFGVASSSSAPAGNGWPAISAASAAASSRTARGPSAADSSAARDKNVTVAAYPPRSRARPAACSSRAATASSGPAAAVFARCPTPPDPAPLPSPAAASA